MESYYAKIEDGIVTFVEVVDDDYFNSNPIKYTGLWKKVGTQAQPFIGKGYVHIQEKDIIVIPTPYPSWTLDENNTWQAPNQKPDGDYCWNEQKQQWELCVITVIK